METIPKERLRRIGIQDDISLTIKPRSIAAYGSIAVAAAVIIYLFLQILRIHDGFLNPIWAGAGILWGAPLAWRGREAVDSIS
jgi:hypothetical protein